ncbi:hypothetical protein AGLY_010905 [Aphis glycines]|uniref:Uncharacterized protein n=1 Tax=Aphis glycines TaxID=307491 RepID=A0A6G0TEV7_APHGL|nr:hypothetical protein AGLY_010905 [Aphis glycines]
MSPLYVPICGASSIRVEVQTYVFPDVGYNERLPLAPWAETNRQPAIARSRYSVRTVCGDARCELRMGSYRSTVADRVGVRRRRFDLVSMRDVNCARDYVGRSMSRPLNVRKLVVFRPYDQKVAMLIKSCARDRIGRLWLVAPESVTPSFGLESMRGVSCARDLGRRRPMVAPLELRGKSSLFADNRLRWVSRSSVFVV